MFTVDAPLSIFLVSLHRMAQQGGEWDKTWVEQGPGLHRQAQEVHRAADTSSCGPAPGRVCAHAKAGSRSWAPPYIPGT